jgi:hypothetical protein
MNSLDPSYLRYIYDGIFNGVIASDNESTLPEGLVGLYEDAFLENIPVYSRQKSLEIFACWALLKKEASILFVSEILQLDETEVFELVGTYSTWFNSPESGKYSLYHERIRIYFLQKLNENEIQTLNHRLIVRLQKAIVDQHKDEFEIYALQFLSDHLLVEAFADEVKGKELLDFTKDERNWNRQIKVSNQFTWTKNTIQNTILWTTKYQPKESVFGYLDLVELHHKEQNNAENIVALVANNEIDLALKRMESFGGTDEEGLQRKFILYMLCLIELTLLESKTQPWRKEAIEKILKHFDEQMPIDYSVLKFNFNIYPSVYLVFLLICEFKSLEIEYTSFCKRSNLDFNENWINEIGPFNNFQLKALKEFYDEISNSGSSERYDHHLQKIIANYLINNNYEDSLLIVTNKMFHPLLKEEQYHNIIKRMVYDGEINKACEYYCHINKIEEQKLNNISKIQLEHEIFYRILTNLIDNKLITSSFLFVSKCKEYLSLNILEYVRKKFLEIQYTFITINLQQDFENFILTFELSKKLLNFLIENYDEKDLKVTLAKTYPIYNKNKNYDIKNVTQELLIELKLKKGVYNLKKQEFILFEILKNKINSKNYQPVSLFNYKLTEINLNELLIENFKIKPTVDNLRILNDSLLLNNSFRNQSSAYIEIANFFLKNNEYLDSYKFIIKAIKSLKNIIYESDKLPIIKRIISILINLDKINKCNKIINELSYEYSKGEILIYLSFKFHQINNRILSNYYSKRALSLIRKKISNELTKIELLIELSKLLFEQKKYELSLALLKESISYSDRLIFGNKGVLDNIYIELQRHENLFINSNNLMSEKELKNHIELTLEVLKLLNPLSINYQTCLLLLNYGFEDLVIKGINSIASTEEKDKIKGIIVLDFLKKYKFYDALLILNEISNINYKLKIINEFSQIIIKEKGLIYALEVIKNLQNEEVRKYYLKGWAENVTINDLSEELLLQALPLLKDDPESIEYLLQTHAISVLFFGEATIDEIQKYNRTLNIQWAMDIKSQLHNNDNQV